MFCHGISTTGCEIEKITIKKPTLGPMKKLIWNTVKLPAAPAREVVILILVLVSMFKIQAKGFSQNERVSLDYDQITVGTLLAEIEQATNKSFLYNIRDVDLEKKVSLHEKNKSLKEVLKTLMKNLGLNYEIEKDQIVLFPIAKTDDKNNAVKKMNIPLFTPFVKQQQTVTGTVLDENNVPLPGVNITVEGTSRGTQTDFDGKYEISVEKGEILRFSSVGFKDQAIQIGDESTVNVVLKEGSALDEVLVVAYGKQSKASFTGAAVDVDLSKIDDSPLASFQESLQGNVAGLQMSTESGQPGATPNIRIRGIGSINASSAPLYVVDGIPVVSDNITRVATSSNTIAGINPKDIDNITVLKDASATSIYGSRGANGVILITTKQGKAGKTTFDISAQHGFSKMIWRDQYKPLNTPQHLELLIESRVNAGDTQQEAEDYIYSRVDRTINTDWRDVITRTGKFDQYNISASGGSDKTQFYSSLGFYRQQGVVIGIGTRKFNGRLNLNHQATDRLKIDVGIAANYQKLHTNNDAGNAANPVRALAREVSWEPVFNEDGSYNTDILLTYNPVGLVNENIRNTRIYGIKANLGLTYDILDNLSFQTKGNIDFNLVDEFRFDNPNFGLGRNDGGRGRDYDNKVVNYNITNLLKYDFTLGEDHNLDFTLGQEAQRIKRNSVYAYVANYGAPGLTTLANASEYLDASSERTGSSLSSYFLNASYSFRDKYYFNVTGRRDGSSRFGSDVRYANFGSIGVAWNIAKEDFMENVDAIKELKVRSSYGINGNQEIGDFASRGLYATGADYDGEPGYTYSQQSNPRLTWEKNKPFNVGFDFNWNNRIRGTIEYYTRKTSDLLFNVPISATNGLTDFLANVGAMKNSGWEFALSSINFDNPNGFNWTTDFNITTNKNKITRLEGETIVDGQFIREVGDDFYTFYLPGYAGADPENGDALWFTDETETATTNKYSEAEPYKQGSALPDFYAGLTNTFSYKNLSLSFLLYLNYW